MKRWIGSALIYGLVFLSLTSCVTSPSNPAAVPKQTPVEVSAELKRKYQHGLQLLHGKKPMDGLKTLAQIAKENGNTEVGSLSLVNIGDYYAQHNDFKQAAVFYKMAEESPYSGVQEFPATFKLLDADTKLQDFAGISDLADAKLARPNLTPENRTGLLRAKIEANKVRGNYLGAVGTLIVVAQSASNPTDQSNAKREALGLVESKLTRDDLEKVASGSEFDFLRASAYYRLGTIELSEGKTSPANAHFEAAARLDTDGSIRAMAERSTQLLNARNTVNPRVVGAILPLTGKFQKIGQRILRGLQLSLGVFGKQASDIQLAVIDSEGNAEVARRGFERLIQEDHVIAVVGGILSKEADAIADKGQEYGVPTILLSQKAGLSHRGEFIFQNAVTTEMQVRFLVDVAIHQKNLKHFAIVYLNNPFGVEYANLFWDEVLAQGGDIRAVQPYDSSETDFRRVIERLIGTFYLDDRMSEYKYRFEDWKKQRGNKIRKSEARDILPPDVDFDAIFIPDRPEVVGQVAAMMVSNDVRDVELLGIDSWNTSQIVERVGKLPLEPIFVDTFAPDDTSLSASAFAAEFKTVFGNAPSLFEMQAYESGKMVRDGIEAGESSRISLRQRIATLGVFRGAIGPLAMSESREVVRPLSALTVRDQKIAPYTDARARP